MYIRIKYVYHDATNNMQMPLLTSSESHSSMDWLPGSTTASTQWLLLQQGTMYMAMHVGSLVAGACHFSCCCMCFLAMDFLEVSIQLNK